MFLLFITSAYTQNADIELLLDINLNRNQDLDNTFIGISNSVTPISIGIPILLFSMSMINKDSLMQRKSIYIAASIATNSIFSTILKHSINRPRPFESYLDVQNMMNVNTASFPSGHTSTAFALATSLSIAYPKWYVIVPSYTFAGVVGYSRMDLGVHYPSDVLAGAILGAGSAFLCYKAQQWIFPKDKR